MAIEIDVTNRSHPEIYQALGVPKLWQYKPGKLKFLILTNNKYIKSKTSNAFPDFPLLNTITRYLEMCRTKGRNQSMRAFWSWVKDKMKF